MRAPPLPTVSVRVRPDEPSQLPSLAAQLQLRARYDASFRTHLEETGEMVVTGPSLDRIDGVLANIPDVRREAPHVDYRETVTCPGEGPAVASPNGLNSLRAASEPIDLSGEALWRYGHGLGPASALWAFGPEPGPTRSAVGLEAEETDYPGFCSGEPTCLLLGTERPNSWSPVHEVEASCISGFHWAMQTGVLAEERCRGVQLRLLDLSLCADAVYRGPGQIVQTSRTAYYRAMSAAGPRLLEPHVQATCLVPDGELAAFQDLAAALRWEQRPAVRVEGQLCHPVDAKVRLLDAMLLPHRWRAEIHSTEWELLDEVETARVAQQLRDRKGLSALYAPAPGGRWSRAPSWAQLAA